MVEKAYEYVDPMRDMVSMMAKKMMESRHWPDDLSFHAARALAVSALEGMEESIEPIIAINEDVYPRHMFADEISVFAMSIFRAIVSDIRRNPAATSAVLATPPTDKKRRPR